LLAGVAATFMNGASMVLARKFSASRFWDDVRKYKATAFNYVGELCRYLLNQPPKPDDANNTIKTILGNGLRPEIWMEFKTRFGIERVTEFYGATEGGGMFINILNFDKTCGWNNNKCTIVKYDIEKDEPVRNKSGFMIKVGLGEAGLLLKPHKYDFNFIGYKDKAATEAKIIHNALKEGDMWMNTGDLVRNQGCGHIMFVDRLGDTFRWKGHNVSTTEVEQIFNSYRQVSMSCVYGVPIPGTDGRAGMAALTTDTKIEDFDFEGLATQLLDNLAPYAVPLFLRFISEMSTTATHKLKKSKLKKECYEIEEIDDPLYVMLPSESTYTKLTPEIYEKIQDGHYMF
jgi:citronellyl-CoA synthetase